MTGLCCHAVLSRDLCLYFLSRGVGSRVLKAVYKTMCTSLTFDHVCFSQLCKNEGARIPYCIHRIPFTDFGNQDTAASGEQPQHIYSAVCNTHINVVVDTEGFPSGDVARGA